MYKLIGITIGDVNGIGIKILINSWVQKKVKNFILFTDIHIIKDYFKRNKLKYRLNIIKIINNQIINYEKNCINIYSFKSNSAEDNTYKSLSYAYDFCKKKICIGMITLPLRKDIVKKIDKNFIGHTEYFQSLEKKKYSNMILFHNKIIISTLTTHIPINKLSKKVSNRLYIYNQIKNLNKTLEIDFNIKKPKIAISGFNPHSGENGEIGKEEIKNIIPVIKNLKKEGIYIDGPFSGDSMLIKSNLTKYHCFVFIYHDQALIPFKYISQFSGVNYTGNLNIIRTSPDHGTAYNLVNSKYISNKSLINCHKLIKKIYKNRIINEKKS